MVNTIISLFLSGIFFGSGPCLFSCGAVFLSYAAGARKGVLRGLAAYLFFSAGRIFVYLVMAGAIFFLKSAITNIFFGGAAKYIAVLAAALIILVGLLTAFGRGASCGGSLKENVDKRSIILGLGLGLLPCAPLLAILSYVGLSAKSWQESLLYSLSFGIGTTVSALILLVFLAGLIPRLLAGKKERYYKVFSFICGLIIVILGVVLLVRLF